MTERAKRIYIAQLEIDCPKGHTNQISLTMSELGMQGIPGGVPGTRYTINLDADEKNDRCSICGEIIQFETTMAIGSRIFHLDWKNHEPQTIGFPA
jgi:hypothetical protein